MAALQAKEELFKWFKFCLDSLRVFEELRGCEKGYFQMIKCKYGLKMLKKMISE